MNGTGTDLTKQTQIKHQRALGELYISTQRKRDLSSLDDFRQSGCLRALFPHSGSDRLTAVFLNTSGGVTGGDCLDLAAHVQKGSELTLTSQTAERVYQSVGDQVAKISVNLTLEEKTKLNWFPQETILFNGSRLRRAFNINMAANARLLMVEPLIFGRAAMGETLTEASINDQWKIRREGRLIFADMLRLSGNIQETLKRKAIANNEVAMAGFLLVCPDAEKHLDRIRALLPEMGGVSLIREGVLFGRILAQDSFELRRSLVPILTQLNESPLPKTWTL